MTLDEIQRRLDERLRHLPFPCCKVDRNLLEMVWLKLDHALEHRRLEVRDATTARGVIREITTLGIIRYYIDPVKCRIWGMAMKVDGDFHPIGPGLPALRLFRAPRCNHWWLRFAFQTWIPRCAGIDLIDDPLYRPSEVELDTSRQLMRRLDYDSRFKTLVEDFDDALGLPPFVRSLIEAECGKQSCNVDRASEIWQEMECVVLETRRIFARTRRVLDP